MSCHTCCAGERIGTCRYQATAQRIGEERRPQDGSASATGSKYGVREWPVRQIVDEDLHAQYQSFHDRASAVAGRVGGCQVAPAVLADVATYLKHEAMATGRGHLRGSIEPWTGVTAAQHLPGPSDQVSPARVDCHGVPGVAGIRSRRGRTATGGGSTGAR